MERRGVERKDKGAQKEMTHLVQLSLTRRRESCELRKTHGPKCVKLIQIIQ